MPRPRELRRLKKSDFGGYKVYKRASSVPSIWRTFKTLKEARRFANRLVRDGVNNQDIHIAKSFGRYEVGVAKEWRSSASASALKKYGRP